MANLNLKAIISAEDQTKGAMNSFKSSLSALAQVAGSAFAFDKLSVGISGALDASKKMENALVGLSSVSGALGQDIAMANKAAKDLSEDGLMSVNESAEGLKNLLATGFSLPQAIQLMNSFKDAAAFNRQGTLGFGEAIVGATQGIKNQNSIMVDNVGITKNLSNILKEAGLSVNDLGNVTSDASVRQKLYNGLVREAALFQGDAAKSAQLLSGKQSQWSVTLFQTKQKIGDLLKIGVSPLISKSTELLKTNSQLIVSLTIAGGAALAFTASVLAVGQAIKLATMLASPLTATLLVLSALVGTVVYKAMNNLQKKFNETSTDFATGAKDIGKNSENQLSGKAKKAAEELREKLADIDAQIIKSKNTFKENLAEMIKDHQKKVIDLKSQIDDENSTFREKEDEKKIKFEDDQKDLTKAHQDKVDSIKRQIIEESNSGSDAADERIAYLKNQLAQENADYDEHFTKLSTDYQTDTAKAKAEHDQKLLDIQTSLNEETALLEKHKDDVLAVKDFQFRDEIQKLKDAHAEELVEFNNQKDKAIQSSKDTTTGIATALNDLPNKVDTSIMNGIGADMGTNMANAFKQAFKDSFTGIWDGIKNFGKSLLDKGGYEGSLGQKLVDMFRANGGPVSSNQPYIVGERGPELFVPNSSGNIIPNNQISNKNVTINNYNTFTRSSDPLAFARELGFQLSR